MLVGCQTGYMNMTAAGWDVFESTILDRQVHFELPKNGNYYRKPAASIPELEERGFIYLYRVGYGYSKRSGYNARVRINLHISPYVDGPLETLSLDALKHKLVAAGNESSRRAGKEPIPSRYNDFEDYVLGGREWTLLEYPKPSGIGLFTHFNTDTFVMLSIDMPRGTKPTSDRWRVLKGYLIEVAERMQISPGGADT